MTTITYEEFERVNLRLRAKTGANERLIKIMD
jgi:hypothetical protein